MISICCAMPKPDFRELTQEEYQTFCYMVHQLKRQGYAIEDAKVKAYHQVLAASIPFNAG